MLHNFFKSIRILNSKYFNIPEILTYFTVIFTITLIYIIMSQEQLGSQIKFQIPTNLPVQDLAKIERKCLNSPLINVKHFDAYGQQISKNVHPRKYDYYRWIIAVMFLLTFIAIIPLAYFKKVISRTPLAEEILYQDAVKIEDKIDQIAHYTPMFAEYINFERIKKPCSFTVFFYFSKMTTVLTPVVLFSILQLFIDAPHTSWFVELIYKILYGTEQEIEPFPTNVYCNFISASHMHIVEYRIRCFLEFNIFFEKFSAILSLWYIILFVFNFTHSSFYSMWLFLPNNRERFIIKRLFYNKVDISEDDLTKFIELLGWDGYINLVKLEERFGYQFLSKFLADLKYELMLFQ